MAEVAATAQAVAVLIAAEAAAVRAAVARIVVAAADQLLAAPVRPAVAAVAQAVVVLTTKFDLRQMQNQGCYIADFECGVSLSWRLPRRHTDGTARFG